MALNETFKASVIGQLADGTAVVFDYGYVDLNPGIEHVDTGTMAGNFQTLVQDKMAQVLPVQFTFKRYRFACVGGTHAGEVGYVEVDPPVVGELLGVDNLPNEICIGLKRSTGHTSRRDRGRIFFGPVDSTLVDDDNRNIPEPNSALNDVRDTLKLNLAAGGYELRPAIIAANGTYSGRTIIHVGYSPTFLHRKSRRPRIGA